MVIRALSLVVVLLLCSVPAAFAEPVKLQPRLESGDTMHFTQDVHYSVSGASYGTHSYDYSFGLNMAVEDLQDDGSATVRETVDGVDVTGDMDPSTLQELVGKEFTYKLHPDGSMDDFRAADGGDDSTSAISGWSMSFLGTLPQDGLEVGKPYEVNSAPISSLVGVETGSLPVRTTLEALVMEQDRPAARVVQALKIPQTDVPYGPFGATGTVKLSGDARSTAFIALDTHWPLRQEMNSNYDMAFVYEGKQQSVSVQLNLSMVMDDQNLNDADTATPDETE